MALSAPGPQRQTTVKTCRAKMRKHSEDKQLLCPPQYQTGQSLKVLAERWTPIPGGRQAAALRPPCDKLIGDVEALRGRKSMEPLHIKRRSPPLFSLIVELLRLRLDK